MNIIEHPKERMIEEWGNYSEELDIEDYDFSIKILDKLPINIEKDNFWEDAICIKDEYLKLGILDNL